MYIFYFQVAVEVRVSERKAQFVDWWDQLGKEDMSDTQERIGIRPRIKVIKISTLPTLVWRYDWYVGRARSKILRIHIFSVKQNTKTEISQIEKWQDKNF